MVTFRPEFAPRWTGHPHVTLLSLGRLGRRQGAAIVERLAGGVTLPAEVLRQIVDRTDGVPLFVEELTKAVLESGLLRKEGGYALAGRVAPLAIPSTLHDSLMARLDRLAPVKEVAQVGAAIGREFSRELLAAVAPLPEGGLDEALERLTEAELVFPRGLPPGTTYVFKHALVQEAAYQSLLKGRRVDLHGRIARALERHMPDTVEAQPELLAHHYSEAGLAREAIGYWLKAGERAAGRSAHPEAIAHLRRGLGLVELLTEPDERAGRELDLQIALGISLLATKGFAAPEVGETYRRAERLAAGGGQHARLYAILQGQFHHHAVRGEIGRCLQLAERCQAMARSEGDPVLLLGAHYTLCAGVCWRGEFAAAKAHLEEVLRLEDVAGRRPLRSLIGIDLRVFARAFGCHALWHFGLVDRAVALSDEAIALARGGADPFSLVIALSYGAMLRQFGHDRRAAERLAQEAIDVCAERHFAYYLAWATIIRGWAEATAGSVGEGLAGLRQGLAAIEATGSRLRRPYYLSLLADALARAGRVEEALAALEEALAALEEALATSEATGERWRDADLHRLRGSMLLTLPDRRAGDAEACFTTALALARHQDALALELQVALDLARLWADRGRRRQARELLAPIHARFTEGVDTPDLTAAATLLEALG